MTVLRPARAEDADAVHALLAERSRALLGLSEETPQALLERWRRPGFRGWVAESGGLVGYASLDAAGELEHVAADTAVGDRLLDAALAAADGSRLSATTLPGDESAAALLRRHGFALDRAILRMWHPQPGRTSPPAFPPGVENRTYADADAPAVKALLDEAYAGWDEGYVARSLEDWLGFMTGHAEFDPGLWLLAEQEGLLVGCALHWRPAQGRGWLKDLAVAASARGAGLGRALLRLGLARSAERGARAVGLKVDDANPTGALQLYEQEGFAVDRRYLLWSRRP